MLSVQIADAEPRVRLEAARSLAEIHSVAAAEIAMRALDRPMDHYLDYALWLTARDLQPIWLPAVQAGTATFDNNPEHLTFALQAVGSAGAVQPLMTLLSEGRIPDDRTEAVLVMIATLGGPRDLGAVFDLALADGVPVQRRRALLAGLAKTAEQRHVTPAGNLNRLDKLIDSADTATGALAARTAGLWHLEALRGRLTSLARDPATAAELRQGSLEGLAHLGGRASQRVLEELSGPSRPYEIRAMAAVALAGIDLASGARWAADVLRSAPAGSDPTAVFAEFLVRKDGATAPARAISAVKLPPDVAKLGIRAVRATASNQPELVNALNKSGGLAVSGSRMPVGDELKRMIVDVQTSGSAVRGEMIFRRQEQSCTKCHAIGGVGGQVGPDLISIGAAHRSITSSSRSSIRARRSRRITTR